MKLEICSKYNIGDIVRKYETVCEYKNKIVCPLCSGKHFVDNPKYDPYNDYDDDYDDSRLECPHCNREGYIETEYVTERVLGEEVYRITEIYVTIKKDRSIEYVYGISSTPELNNRTFGYCGCNASEDDLEFLRSY